ncbi:Hypothetical protein A7982_05745 [Minicystis rosea]|nr:Hypothetical protein A7982_05745 [Minicystis rosea]
MRPDDDRLISHATALFGAISLALAPFGCGSNTTAGSSDTGIASVQPSAAPSAPPVPAAAATDSATPTAPTPPAESAAPPAASASAAPSAAPSASARPLKPRRPKPRVVEGRPFLVEDVARVAAIEPGSGWSEAIAIGGMSIEPAERAALLEHYTRWALAEHASIASFARFSLQLLALGAPSDLVSRAVAAMEDETRHARLGFGIVNALGAAPIQPGALPIEGSLDQAVTLADVLRLTVREGVIGETLAALEARLAANETSIPWLREPLVRLAADESRHAELAFAFAAWAVGRDPALLEIIEEELELWQPPPLDVVSGLERWGALDTSSRRAVHHEGLRTVIRPLVAQLAGAAPRTRTRSASPSP